MATRMGLQEYLEQREETVRTFAERIGRSPSTLTRLMRGERNPSLSIAEDVQAGTRGKVTREEFMLHCMVARRRALRGM
jgi:transcriptional regulator with XRE-family HTH domain